MADSYTASFRFTLQTPGENNNTWGTRLNNGVFQLMEDALAGAAVISGSGPILLTVNLGATDQARCMGIIYTGPGATVTAPGQKKLYWVDNSAGTGPLIITTGSGRVASVSPGARMFVYCSDVVNFDIEWNANLLAAANSYTDNKVLIANAGNLPGGAVNGYALFTSGSAALWRQITETDVANLIADLLTRKRRATALAFAL